jgi:DNA-binding SARP family transcriptional activator/lipopolysaccharide biosynthesis regulator YciM
LDATPVEFGVLGQLQVRTGRGTLRIAGQRQQRILAMMLVNAERTVPLDHLVTALWDDEPPLTAKRQMQNCVSDLRRQLPAGSSHQMIVADAAGYRLNLDAGRLDLRTFEQRVAEANRLQETGDLTAAAGCLRAALGLWRGPALAGLTGRIIEGTATRLDELRLSVTERCVDLELRLGRHADLVAELLELVAAHPLRERLVGQLMVALYRCGRKADALGAYRHLHTRLVDELGLDPGVALQELHTAVLQDAVPALPPADPGPPPTGAPPGRVAPPPPAAAAAGPAGPIRAPAADSTPAQLPAGVAHFTGRREALDQLDDVLLAGGEEPTQPALAIAVVLGSAGVGKTALAVHWAHLVRHRFPDGQLHVDLRGYAPGVPLAPLEALTRFLGALGCDPQRVPADLEQAAELYRTLLADRRVLVVLDNARSADQVRPLLPGSPGCLVLVTSRSRLGGLVARDGARRVVLEPLREDEAHTLLRRLVGAERVAAEPDAARDLARLCERIPLALRIAAANLGDRPWGIAAYVAKLRATDRLAALAVGGDEQAAVRTAFDLSYQGLDPDARRMFRLLGLAPCRDFGAAAAAALCAASLPRVEGLLDEIAGAHLLQEHAPGRYTFHDLLRLYAVERAAAEESDADRAAALDRLATWYGAAADAVARAAYPEMLRLPAAPPRRGGPAFAAAPEALAFMESEQHNVVSLVEHLADRGPQPRAWQLADALRGYFWRRMHTVDWTRVARAGLAATEKAEDPKARCAAHLSMADVLMRQSRYDEAIEHYRRTVALGRQAQWPAAQVTAGACLGTAYRQIGRPAEAERQLQEALALARRLREPYKEAVLLGYLGQAYRELGRLDESVAALTQADRLFAAQGSPHGSAVTWGILGGTYRAKGMLDEAAEYVHKALDGLRSAGDRSGESQMMQSLAVIARDRGELVSAAQLATAALKLAEQINDRRATVDAHNTLASIEDACGQHGEAAARYRRAVEIARQSRDRVPEIESYLGLARAYRGLDRPEQVREHARTALDMARDGGYRPLVEQAEGLLA